MIHRAEYNDFVETSNGVVSVTITTPIESDPKIAVKALQSAIEVILGGAI